MEQDKLEQRRHAGGGIEIDMPFTIGVVWAVLCTDVLQSLEYKTRPYEVERRPDRSRRAGKCRLSLRGVPHPPRNGEMERLVWHLTTDYFSLRCARVFRKFEAIEVDRLQPKPIVKITGEFYLQTVEGDPNYNIHRWLEAEGAEVYPAPIVVWLDYLVPRLCSAARGLCRHRPHRAL